MTRRRLILSIAVLASAAVIIGTIAFRSAGSWLVGNDVLKPARAIVVFGGGIPFRPMEAAAIYKQGWAREVWLTRGAVDPEDSALAELQVERPSDYFYSRLVLERLGVPSPAIRVLSGQTPDTAEEVRVVARELKAEGGDTVILITSKYHTRRVRFIWHALVGNRPEAIVRYTSTDPFQPQHWWGNTRDAMAVSREWMGLMNAWAGFPLKHQRP